MPSEGVAERDDTGEETSILRTQIARLEREREVLHQEIASREAEIKRLRAVHRKSTSRRTAARPSTEQAFTDPEMQFRWEVELAWVERIPAGEKPRRPLADYAIGPEFLDTVEELQGVARDKIVDVVVEVLTGIADESSGRQMHQLRTGWGPAAPTVVDASGRTAWRVNLQTNAANARRLHFWRGTREIELSRVVAHDDMTP